MIRQCQHQWTECTHVMRELLGPSEYGGWEVGERAYFVCGKCLTIESRPANPAEIIRTNFAAAEEEALCEALPAVA